LLAEARLSGHERSVSIRAAAGLPMDIDWGWFERDVGVVPRRRRGGARRMARRIMVLLLNAVAILCGYLSFGFSLVLISGNGSANQTPAAAAMFLLAFLFCMISIAMSNYFLDTRRPAQAITIALAPPLVFLLLVLISF
jgi:hypothetical protein